MDFTERVRLLREKLNMSQEDLARELNVSFSTINRWENGKAKPIKLAKAAFDALYKNHSINFDKQQEDNNK